MFVSVDGESEVWAVRQDGVRQEISQHQTEGKILAKHLEWQVIVSS